MLVQCQNTYNSDDYNIEEFVNEVKKFIEDRELDGNPDNFIHCIWYCITGTRFEDIEEKTLLTLTSIYDDLKLPIIVVYTQATKKKLANKMTWDLFSRSF